MERVIEALESQCHENMEIKKKTEEGLGIEYDEDIVCEICQSVSCITVLCLVIFLSGHLTCGSYSVFIGAICLVN